MEIKELIRQYESLINQKPSNFQEKTKLEKQWLMLHQNFLRAERKLPQKRKKEVTTFIKKTLENARNVSGNMAFIFNKKTSFEFTYYQKKYHSVYLKSGIRALYDIYLKHDKQALSMEECLRLEEERHFLKHMTTEEWKSEVYTTLGMEIQTRKQVFEVEKKCLTLFQWEERNKNDVNVNPEMIKLCERFYELQNKILLFLGYNLTCNEIASNKKQRSNLRALGMLAYLEALEKENKSPAVDELLRQIAFVHPKDEFAETRSMRRHFVIHAGPTNSGKTYHALQELKQSQAGAYLAPLRLLALEVRDKLQMSGIPCDLVTGEEVILADHANHRSSTIETANFDDHYDVVVIDEMQFIEDNKRGYGWLRAICGVKASVIHLCGAPHALEFIQSLIEECGDTYEIVHYERQTPLTLEKEPFQFPMDVRRGDALIAFTKAKVIELSDELRKRGKKVSVLYGKLPAATRQHQVDLFASGETEVLVATDVIGIGLNLPIERIVLMDIEKFDGTEKRLLTTQEVKQIAGRAGRRGHHENGFVNAPHGKDYIEKCLYEDEGNITSSVVMPTTQITDLPMGTLRQRLMAWQQAHLTVPYLQKADITDQIMLLKQVEEWEHELSIKDLYKAIYIPFDSKERKLLLQWTEHVEEFKEGNKRLSKPKRSGSSLVHLETYYHQLHLYYQFGKKMKMEIDLEWFQNQRRLTSREIDHSFSHRNSA